MKSWFPHLQTISIMNNIKLSILKLNLENVPNPIFDPNVI